MSIDYELFFEKQDELIRSGLGNQVRANIKKLLKAAPIPGRHLGRLGQLYRRVGLPMSTIKLLHKTIYFDEKINPNATDFELLQYGAALVAIGANNEGLKILNLVAAEKEPEKNLNNSIALFHKWKYSEALPYLLDFVNDPRLTPYQKLVGQINLASCYVSLREYQKANDTASQVLHETEKSKLILLKGFALEIISETLLWQKKYKECDEMLNAAKEHLALSGSSGFVWLQKWSAVNLLFQGDHRNGIQKLRELRQACFQTHEWETIRECDLFEAKFNHDKDLFLKVYFGSPLEDYRRRAYQIFSDSKETDSQLKLPEYYDWQPPSDDAVAGAKKIFSPDREVLPGYLYQLFYLLSEDFYKPVRIVQIHERLFPSHFFHPIHSVKSIYDLISRLKRELRSSGLQIVSQGSGYFLSGTGNTFIRKELNFLYQDRHLELLRSILEIKPDRSFTTDDLQKYLDLSRTSAHRFLKWALENNKIQKHGQGKNTFYRQLPPS